MTPPTLESARRACRELGGAEVDLWSLPQQAVERATVTGRGIDEAARDVVSGWLAVRAARGDGPARDRLLALWHGPVLKWCRWNAGSGVDPEDAAHEVLIRALRRPPPPGPTYRSWLWGIVWRVLREQERRAWVGRWFFGDPPEPVDAEPLADEGIAAEERAAAVRRVLQGLELEDRTVLWLAYVEGVSRAGLAETLGWSEGTVNRRLTRARAAFDAGADAAGLAPETLSGIGRRSG